MKLEGIRLVSHCVIGTTSRCNARCTFCFRDRVTRPQGTMADATFEKIVAEHPCDVYTLCLFGDPLMDKRIAARVAHIRKTYPAAGVLFHTNGGLLTHRRCAELVDAGLSEIYVSCYGKDAEQHDRLQPPVKFAQVVDMATHLRRIGMPVYIVTNRVEPMDLEQIGAFWRERGCEVVSEGGLDWGNGERVGVMPPDLRMQCLLALGYRVFDWDGSFVTCCLDFNGVNNFGNVHGEQTWEDAICGLRHREMPFCAGCIWQGRFDTWRWRTIL